MRYNFQVYDIALSAPFYLGAFQSLDLSFISRNWHAHELKREKEQNIYSDLDNYGIHKFQKLNNIFCLY